MPFTREFFDPFLVYTASLALCAALLTARFVREPYRTEMPSEQDEPIQLGAIASVCTIVAAIAGNNAGGALLAAGLATLIVAGLRLALPRLTLVGAMIMAGLPLSFLSGAPWAYLLLRDAGAPGWLLTVSVLGTALATISLGLTFAEGLARQALLTHIFWRRPHRALKHGDGSFPKVSVQVPCYAEPPDLVIATLDRLAALDYPHFEVLVIDNNTKDEALWRPLEAHCARLNADGKGRFRFFHVAPLPGAKAGALNYVMDHMAPDAELIAVIDADYLAAPDFLSRIVGFFDDPDIGYVQTPHDYRDWRGNPYLTACYWEYMPNNKIELSGLNEYGAAFTIGTMCVLRTKALRAAGNWAEWCLTEDSEVSVRLRALGYGGIYLRETFGRGLIPDTFSDYKKQRFRWTAGPVQQLRRHWRLYLPQPFGKASALDNWSKLLEFQRGIAPVLQAVGMILGTIGSGVFLVLAAAGTVPVIDLPAAAWFASVIGAASLIVSRWHRYRLSGCNRVPDMLRGELARLSLTYVQMLGGLAGLSLKPIAWTRTPKFKARGSGFKALAATLPETAIGIAQLLLIAVPILLYDNIGGDMLALMIVGALLSSLQFLAAPVMALMSERALAEAHAVTPLQGDLAQVG